MKKSVANRSQSLYSSRIDLSEDIRVELVGLANQQLADTIDLYLQTKQAHWNVKGPQFYSLHTFFDDLAESIEEYIDEIGERVTALGGVALGTVRMAAEFTTLEEFDTDIVTGDACLEALVARYSAYAASTRIAIERASELGDPTTEDLFTEISRVIDKNLYFLESHMQS
jgi:starvation-inducible DNA-binding protein